MVAQHGKDEVMNVALDRTGRDRVLVVDDDRGVKKGIALWLRRRGFAVDEASDGDEALDLLARISYKLVITDLVMPRRDGAEILSWVRRFAPDTLCLLITSHPSSALLDRARVLAGGHVLPKPFSLDAVDTAVRGLLRPEARSA